MYFGLRSPSNNVQVEPDFKVSQLLTNGFANTHSVIDQLLVLTRKWY
jgi:hypothetical protein